MNKDDDRWNVWTCKCGNTYKYRCPSHSTNGTSKQEWVGLSNHDIEELIPRTDLSGDYGYQDMYAVARIVEYRLRMQNHG